MPAAWEAAGKERYMQIEVPDVREADVRTVRKNDPDYPKRMQNLPDMPDVFYCLGRLPSNDAPTAAIVGARMCTPYGRRVAEEFGRTLAARGVQIISGMALGVDGYGHRGCLDAGGDTFAVLGGGVNVCYPAKNRDIYEKIRNTGGIISEQPFGTEPLSFHFPRRNRIISALSDVVIVVEARKKSGSLITAEFAAEQGKDVFAVPGRIGDALSDGCNELIADGAFIACSPEIVLERIETLRMTLPFAASEEKGSEKRKYRRYVPQKNVSGKSAHTQKEIKAGAPEKKAPQERRLPDFISLEAARIYACLGRDDPTGENEIREKTGLSDREVSSASAELLLEGFVREVGRGFYVRKF